MATKRSPPVAAVPEALHDPEHPEHLAVSLQEAAPGLRQRLRPPGAKALLDRLCRHAAAGHRVVDALARSRRDDPGRVAGQHHIAAVVPARQRLHRNGRALTAQCRCVAQARHLAQPGGGRAQREALVGAAGAHAQRVPVREHPAVEVGRPAAVVDDVAARAVIAGRRVRGPADDLVVRKDVSGLLGARHRLPRHFGARAVGTDHAARAHAGAPLGGLAGAVAAAEMDDAGAVLVARQALEGADPPHRTGFGGALAQPFVEHIAVDHAHEAALDRDVDLGRAGCDHAGAADARNQQMVGNVEVADQPRRDRPTAGLDAPGTVQQQHRATLPDQVVRRGGARGPAADHDDVVGERWRGAGAWTRCGDRAGGRGGHAGVHRVTPCKDVAADRSADGGGAGVAGMRMRAASMAAATNRPASTVKTLR